MLMVDPSPRRLFGEIRGEGGIGELRRWGRGVLGGGLWDLMSAVCDGEGIRTFFWGGGERGRSRLVFRWEQEGRGMGAENLRRVGCMKEGFVRAKKNYKYISRLGLSEIFSVRERERAVGRSTVTGQECVIPEDSADRVWKV